MNRRLTWEPSDADLTAYLLNDLGGARAEYVEAHLEQCPECRERLRSLEQALGHLETMPEPDDDDFLQQSVIKRRIQMEAESITQGTERWLQRARIGLVAVAMLTLAIVLGPTLTDAGNAAIRELIGIESDLDSPATSPQPADNERSLATVDPSDLPAHPTIEPSELPYAPIAPAQLPGSNQLVETTAFASGSFIADYLGSDGLRLALRQEPATTDGVRFSGAIDYDQIQIRDAEVIVIMNKQIDDVDQMFWVRGGMFFTLRAVRLSDGDFPLEEATRIVERLMDLQDHPESLPAQ